jgi:uncharacterized protein YdhG (YjbR/CyaY superfamily)
MSTVDEYFASLDLESRGAFEKIRDLALEMAPESEAGTSYGMAALIYKTKPLIGFRAAQRHLSIFPFSPDVVDGVSGQLAGFDLSKGTIRFTAAEPIPDDVVREIVRRRVAEISASR